MFVFKYCKSCKNTKIKLFIGVISSNLLPGWNEGDSSFSLMLMQNYRLMSKKFLSREKIFGYLFRFL